MDVVPILADDPRVELAFTMAPGSVFDDGLPELLDGLAARRVPWAEAVRHPFDLALTASPNGDLHTVRAPLVLLPHGAGFNKLPVGADPDGAPAASGLTAAQLLHEGRVVPTGIALGHPDQIRRLRRHCPPAAERATVVGDPCYDRLRASLPWRADYREALGVREGQSLVVLSSTWGPESLIGRHPGLPARLLAELPRDEYRIALILHPNVWSFHGEFQLRLWLASALAAGLMLVPPEEGWRAALVAADRFVGDHGSVTLYAAGVGLPVLLAADGGGEVANDSPMNRLSHRSTRLDLQRPLLPQFARPAEPTPVPSGAFSDEGRSLTLLSELVYRHLALAAPTRPLCPQPVPLPRIAAEPVRELLVRTRLVEADVEGKPALVRIERFPARLTELTELAEAPAPGSRQHLLCEPGPQAHRLAQGAAVLARRADATPDWLERTLARHPACQVAALVLDDVRCALLLRSGARLTAEFRPDPASGASAGADPLLAASALQHVLATARTARPPAALRIELGGHRYTAVFTAALPLADTEQ